MPEPPVDAATAAAILAMAIVARVGLEVAIRRARRRGTLTEAYRGDPFLTPIRRWLRRP